DRTEQRETGMCPAGRPESATLEEAVCPRRDQFFSLKELMVRQEGRKVTVVWSHKKQSPGEDGGSFWEYQEMHKEMLLPADLELDAMTCSLPLHILCQQNGVRGGASGSALGQDTRRPWGEGSNHGGLLQTPQPKGRSWTGNFWASLQRDLRQGM
uniref:Uncharacterized protein n=1 Tax=Crocodylus porosus TaxID=8502 RepID=A0A7M4EDC7_CROPO